MPTLRNNQNDIELQDPGFRPGHGVQALLSLFKHVENAINLILVKFQEPLGGLLDDNGVLSSILGGIGHVQR